MLRLVVVLQHHCSHAFSKLESAGDLLSYLGQVGVVKCLRRSGNDHLQPRLDFSVVRTCSFVRHDLPSQNGDRVALRCA